MTQHDNPLTPTDPKGGLQGYQDDFDTSQHDPLLNDEGDAPTAPGASRRDMASEFNKTDHGEPEEKEDLREQIEDLDEDDDKDRATEKW